MKIVQMEFEYDSIEEFESHKQVILKSTKLILTRYNSYVNVFGGCNTFARYENPEKMEDY